MPKRPNDSIAGVGLGRPARKVDPKWLHGTPDEVANRSSQMGLQERQPGATGRKSNTFVAPKPEQGKPFLDTLGQPSKDTHRQVQKYRHTHPDG